MSLNKLAWKPVQLNNSIFINDASDLIGIEECMDYDLNFTDDSVSNEKKKKLADDKWMNKRKKKSRTNNYGIGKNEICLSNTGSTVTDFVTEKLNITCNGPSSNKQDVDLSIVTAWTNFPLPDVLIKALAFNKFHEPTQIQSLTLPPAILGRRDILGAAETGSGKTLAFGLPIITGILKEKESKMNELHKEPAELKFGKLVLEKADELDENGLGCVGYKDIKLSSSKNKALQALILTPTRELAIQVKNHLTALLKYSGIKVAVIVGGMSIAKQERILKLGPEIVVATPGRLWELVQEGNEHLSGIGDIKYLAIDETDSMIERGHFEELYNILEKLNVDQDKKKLRQNFVFSATLTLTHELPKHLALKKRMKLGRKVVDITPERKLQQIIEILGITNPKVIDITKGQGTPETLTESRITCNFDEKDYYVYYFLKRHPGRTLIFCNSIGCVKRLTTILTLLECKPFPLHASMQQRQRLKNLDRFKDNEEGLLIATDVAARGLDIPRVEHVIHYQTPRTSESYVHRSGRTARATRYGITILLVEPTELNDYLRLCKTLGKGEDIPSFPVQESILSAVKERVNLARELDKLQLQVRKTNTQVSWIEKAANEMDLVFEERTFKQDKIESNKYKKIADIKRKELASLLRKPIFPKGFSGKYLMNVESAIIPLMPQSLQHETAIDVMKSMLQKEQLKKARSLFKPKMSTKTGSKLNTVQHKSKKNNCKR